MNFKTRNLFYLRISEHSVLPVYVSCTILHQIEHSPTESKLYLDERHLDWMSDQVLQHILSDLRPRILPKLLSEAGNFVSPAAAKKAAVDTWRGDTYQFCYFLRRTEPHSVAIKTRSYVARTQIPSQFTHLPAAAATITIPRRTREKRKTRSGSTLLKSSSSRSTKKRKKDVISDSNDSEGSEGGGPTSTRPDVPEVVDVDRYEETINVNAEELIGKEDETRSSQQDSFDLHADEEEKPKPTLQLRYKGFGIYGQCLCIVAEPWPAIRSTTRSLEELGGITGPKFKEKQAAIPTNTTRVQTPLFLADEDDSQSQHSIPVANSWDGLETMEVSDDDSEMGGMIAFSQALNIAGDTRPGAVEDEDEMEGAVLFGDADEARQL